MGFSIEVWNGSVDFGHVRSGGKFLANLRGRHSPHLKMAIVANKDLGSGLGVWIFVWKIWPTFLGGERGI